MMLSHVNQNYYSAVDFAYFGVDRHRIKSAHSQVTDTIICTRYKSTVAKLPKNYCQ